jgi:hypothetical protein
MTLEDLAVVFAQVCLENVVLNRLLDNPNLDFLPTLLWSGWLGGLHGRLV